MDVEVQTSGIAEARKRLGAILSPSRLAEMNGFVGESVLEFTRDHLDTMARSRHKCADRLGAKYTHHFDYASGRVKGMLKDGQKPQATDLVDVTKDGFTVSIRNTPGLFRAFGPVTIRPKRAKWLTIPIHKDAYGKRVKDLRDEGRVLFRPGNARILAESETYTEGRGKNRKKKTRLRPLFALCKSTTSPQDRGLLPTRESMVRRAVEAAEDFLLTE